MLTVYGATVVTLMMVCYTLESRSRWFTLAFAAACLGSASYGFLAGTWPFGVVETVWALLAAKKWHGLQRQAALLAEPGSPPSNGPA